MTSRARHGLVRGIIDGIIARRVNLLLFLVPMSWLLGLVAPGSVWLFAFAALAIVPLAGLIGHATEELAKKSGPTLGGFLNATFGNAAELIIGIAALRENHIALVQASITGSIIGNLLLVFGLSMFVGGLGRQSQRFDRTSAGNATIMLFLGVVALAMPAVFDLTIFGTLEANHPEIHRLSLWTAALLILAYLSGLVYTFRTQRDLLRPAEAEGPAHWTRAQSVAVLTVGTVLTAIQAEVLVGALEPTLARLGWSELFTGGIVVALVGNAAEHYSAVVAARNNQMTMALEIAVGSSAQIALLIAPLLVLLSFALGNPMTLLFHPFEIAAVGLSVIAVAIVSLDGESNWVEGIQLLAVYWIVGLAFYLIP
jgi:Ca2+:H+ antiporter